MRKILILYLLLIWGIMGCASSNYNYLSINDLVEKISYNAIEYYVVKVADLRNVRKPGSLTYVGSTNKYHLIHMWSYVLPNDEIYNFAIKKDKCIISDEVTPEEEDKYVTESRKGWRKIDILNGKCIIPGRKK
jgi:hypothetical protein